MAKTKNKTQLDMITLLNQSISHLHQVSESLLEVRLACCVALELLWN